MIGGVFLAWFRQRVSLDWLGTDPALAAFSHEARWADVPPDWHVARAEYQEDQERFT